MTLAFFINKHDTYTKAKLYNYIFSPCFLKKWRRRNLFTQEVGCWLAFDIFLVLHCLFHKVFQRLQMEARQSY